MLRSIDELKKIRDDNQGLLFLRKNPQTSSEKREILVCGGTGCHSSMSKEIVEVFNVEIEKMNLMDKVSCHITGCFGFCEKGPIVKVFPDDDFYTEKHYYLMSVFRNLFINSIEAIPKSYQGDIFLIQKKSLASLSSDQVSGNCLTFDHF